MIQYHNLKIIDINLENAITNHSADKVIAYKTTQNERISLGFYFPSSFESTKKHPTFLLIHGGGWSTHKIFNDQNHWSGDYLGFLCRYYAEKGFVTVSIDYRLIRQNGHASGYGILNCYEDCCDAVAYILAHAAEYGVDTECLYLLGESAGGHLAGLLISPSDTRIYSFKKAFLINPITDLYDEKWNWAVPIHDSMDEIANLHQKKQAEFLSPLYRACANTCEVILIHGEADTTVDLKHSQKFYDRMQELCISCELHIIEKTKHAFLLAEYYPDIVACKMTIQMINERLGC